MSKASDLRRQRREKSNTARRRAATHASGFETTCFRMPEGLSFWNPSEGIYTIDIVPFIAGEGNPFADPGELHWERTYWRYNKIGAAEKPYVCPSKTFNSRDFIQEWRATASKDEDKADIVKALAPRERQLFLVWDYKEKDKGVQLWEFSFHQFGKLLDDRINNRGDEDWDQFYYPDPGGFTLRLTFKDSPPYGCPVIAIDFKPRDDDYAMPDNIKNHGICLDNILIEVPYERLKSIFLMTDESDEKDEATPTASTSTPFEENGKSETTPRTKPATADLKGLSAGDIVSYQGKTMSIMKISGDGTSLTLYDDKTDDIIKAIGVDEVEAANPTKTEKPVDRQTELAEKPSAKVDDAWDDDWS